MIGEDRLRQPIDSSATGKDLGVVVEKKLKFHKYAQMAVGKTFQAVGIIKHTICSRSLNSLW